MRARDAALSFSIACACGDGEAVRGGDTGGDTSDDGGEVGTTAPSDDDDGGDTTHVDPADGSSTDADATSSGESSTTGGGGVPGAWCEPIPTCDAPLPDPGPPIDWEHTETTFVVGSGAAMHRGRDMFFLEDDQHWVLGKFAYGLNDYDLEDEQVDLYLLRNCTGDWEPLGGVRTTWEGDHAEVEGIVDTGGRVYVPLLDKLEPGRHRVHMVVRGDLTRADQYIEVVPPGTPVVLSDVDGTLTTSETEEFFDLLSGSLPEVNPGAAEALQALAAAGYHPIYLTSRPEFLGTRTQQFIHDRGLPPGIVHTSLNYTGALGDAAIEQKTAELAAFAERGLVPTWVFGNTASDADAYDNAGIQPVEQRVFLAYDDAHGGRRIESWQDIVAELQGVPDLCE